MANPNIPTADADVLRQQADGGPEAVRAYTDARGRVKRNQQQALAHANQTGMARGAPAGALASAYGNVEQSFQDRDASLAQAQGREEARSARRADQASAYQQMVMGTRDLIADEAYLIGEPIRAQTEFQIAQMRQQGENSRGELAGKLELEKQQFEFEMRQRAEELARANAARGGGGGGGGGGQSIGASELESMLRSGGQQYVNTAAQRAGDIMSAQAPKLNQQRQKVIQSEVSARVDEVTRAGTEKALLGRELTQRAQDIAENRGLHPGFKPKASEYPSGRVYDSVLKDWERQFAEYRQQVEGIKDELRETPQRWNPLDEAQQERLDNITRQAGNSNAMATLATNVSPWESYEQAANPRTSLLPFALAQMSQADLNGPLGQILSMAEQTGMTIRDQNDLNVALGIANPELPEYDTGIRGRGALDPSERSQSPLSPYGGPDGYTGPDALQMNLRNAERAMGHENMPQDMSALQRAMTIGGEQTARDMLEGGGYKLDSANLTHALAGIGGETAMGPDGEAPQDYQDAWLDKFETDATEDEALLDARYTENEARWDEEARNFDADPFNSEEEQAAYNFATKENTLTGNADTAFKDTWGITRQEMFPGAPSAQAAGQRADEMTDVIVGIEEWVKANLDELREEQGGLNANAQGGGGANSYDALRNKLENTGDMDRYTEQLLDPNTAEWSDEGLGILRSIAARYL